MNRTVHMVLAVAVAVLVALPTVASAQRPRSARDEPLRDEGSRPEGRPPRPHDPAAPEAIVLRFEHIPAGSFMDTFKQLADNEHLREGLRQIPIALNEAANAVVVVAPPEIARVMMRVAAELDHPNAFEQHMQERERDNVKFHMEVEKHKRAMDLETMARRLKLEAMKRDLSGQPRPPHGLQPGKPPHGGPAPMRGDAKSPPPGPMRRGERSPQRGPRGEGGPPRIEEHERMIRAKMEELEAHQRRLRQELEQHAQRVHQQLQEIEQHKHRLREAFERHMRERRGEQERRMPQERERMAQREREEMERREHQEREHMAQREREEMERREHQEREHMAQRKREEMERRERQQRERREGPPARPYPGEGRVPGPRAPAQGRPGTGLDTLLSPRIREQLRLSDDQVERIRDLMARVRQGMEQTMQRIREAAKDMRPEERLERMQQIRERLEAARAERMRGIRERLGEILRPEQREKVEQWRRQRRPAEPPPPPQRPEGSRRPEPRRRPPPPPEEKEHRPTAQEGAAEPVPAAPPRIVSAVYDGAARSHLAARDLDEPGGKPRVKDGFKSPKKKPSEGASADRKRTVMFLRLLQDPGIRAELGLSAEQEKRIFVLAEKVQRIEDRIRDDVRSTLGDRKKGAVAGADRQDIKRQAAEIAKEAQHALAGDMEAIMNEAAEVLTPDQQAKLQVIGRDRAERFRSSGGLAILLEAKVRQKIGISDEQADHIRLILDDASKRASDLRGEISGGNLEDAKRRHAVMARATRERVMAVLSPEQRAMAERLLDRDSPKGGKKTGPAAPATKGYGQAA